LFISWATNHLGFKQQGITHAFVVQFDSVEDRDYYVKEDPAHRAFVQALIPYLAKPYVIDFTPGEFNHGGG